VSYFLFLKGIVHWNPIIQIVKLVSHQLQVCLWILTLGAGYNTQKYSESAQITNPRGETYADQEDCQYIY